MPRSERWPERCAARILRAEIHGSRPRLIRSQSNGQHDIDLCFDDHVEPVEVTRSTNPSVEKQYGDIARRSPIQRSLAQHDWIVTAAEGADVSKVASRLDSYLQHVESEGITEFFSPLDSYRYPSVRSIYSDLKIDEGRQETMKTPGIFVMPAGGSTRIDGEHVLKAVNQAASLADNRRKLGSSNSPRRHLFVLITNNYDAEAALRRGQVPTRAPTLPAEITDAWAAAFLPTGGGWTDKPPPRATSLSFVVWHSNSSGECSPAREVQIPNRCF